MSYQKHHMIIPAIAGGSILCDEHISVGYARMAGMLEELDTLFNREAAGESSCIALEVENSVRQAVLILYLLSEKINFFLRAPASPVHQSLPSFCDKLLSMDAGVAHEQGPAAAVRISRNPEHISPASIHPHSGWVLFSSSGTSGAPKYICYEGESLLHNAENCRRRFGHDKDSRVLVPVPISHMYGMGAGFLPALIAGASICLVERNNVVKLYDKVRNFLPGMTFITPTVARMMLKLDKQLPGERTYITAGESISRDTLTRFREKYGRVINLYGCTELGAIATTPVAPEQRPEDAQLPLQPLDGVAVRLGNDGRIWCRHNAGFMGYVDGTGRISPGYHPDSWYDTRDRGYDAGRECFFVTGRMDNCINRSGFLVSLEEIEALLEEGIEGISKAVVFEGGVGNGMATGVIAVCEVAEGHLLDRDIVKAACRERMNKYLVPDDFYFTSRLPRLGNGKPDRLYLIHHYKNII